MSDVCDECCENQAVFVCKVHTAVQGSGRDWMWYGEFHRRCQDCIVDLLAEETWRRTRDDGKTEISKVEVFAALDE